MSLADQRNVHITKNGTGYYLIVADAAYHISPGEALGLLTSLLHVLPDVPNGPALAARIRVGPRLVIQRTWGHVEHRVVPTGYVAVLSAQGKMVLRCRPELTPELAVARACREYGCELVPVKLIDQPGSKEVAIKKASAWIIMDHLTRSGLTIDALFTKIRSGEVPTETFQPEIADVEVSGV